MTMRLAAVLGAVVLLPIVITAVSQNPPHGSPPPQGRPGNVELTTFPAEWSYKPGAAAPAAEHGKVASNCDLATQAGVEIL